MVTLWLKVVMQNSFVRLGMTEFDVLDIEGNFVFDSIKMSYKTIQTLCRIRLQ